ncbi:hypothetical protein [Streptomyces sp. NPDC059743]|uniref:hypothetical protein n=1 Tax=Streptomyces sp. NPDC059743 TaxID=3346928 RepID=UPI003653A74E
MASPHPHPPSSASPDGHSAPAPARTPRPDQTASAPRPALRRDDETDPVFLVITPEHVELRTLDWFSEHWSREAGHSRFRKRTPLFFRLLAPGTVDPQVFSVHGEEHHGYGYADGRRFRRCSAVITTAPEHPADPPRNYRFRYWEYDPLPEGPPISDVETYALPG